MSEQLYPYVEAIIAQPMKSISFSDSLLREADIRRAILDRTTSFMVSYSIEDIFDFEQFSNHLVDRLIESGAIIVDDQPFAGKYFAFRPSATSQWFDKTLTNNQLLAKSRKVNGSFFGDVFDGYRAQFGILENKKIPKSVLDSIDWSKNEVSISSLSDVKSRAIALIDSINQSEFGEEFKKDAIAHANAVIDLLDAPNPNWKIIVEILNNEYLTAFLNAATLLQLIIGFFV